MRQLGPPTSILRTSCLAVAAVTNTGGGYQLRLAQAPSIYQPYDNSRRHCDSRLNGPSDREFRPSRSDYRLLKHPPRNMDQMPHWARAAARRVDYTLFACRSRLHR